MGKEYPVILTVKDAQELTGLPRSTVYKLLHREDVPTIFNGRRLYLHRDMFLAWLEAQAETSKGA